MKTIFSLLLLCVMNIAAYSGIDTVSTRLTGSAIATGAVVPTAIGTRYINPFPANPGFWVKRSYGLIKLLYPLPDNATARPEGQATVAVQIEYRVRGRSGWETKTTSATLQLDLGTATAQDVSYFKAENAHYINATITSAVVSAGMTDIELEASVVTESFDLLNQDTEITANSSFTSDGNLRISWGAVTGGESYELEWTYVSDQGETSNDRRDPADIEVERFLFRNNSSRVEVKGTSYDIPLVYEKGVIVYRVRPVGVNIVSGAAVPVKGKWNEPDGLYSRLSEYTHRVLIDGLENNINWQSSISFAEEGKNKIILSYHDGSLRNRQAVTRIRSDERAVVGETLYDYNGRPAIHVLPAPVVENNLSFYPHFNVADTKTKLNKADYDQAGEGSGCESIAPPLSTATGASQYYSPSNPFGTNGNTGGNLLNKDLIPDAEKYPYIQLKYTPDNTNRVAAQSGAGPTFKLGGGRETRYFYGAPQQPELTRLFGSQIGFANHYKKNVDADPNGQSTVMYLDPEGKVVASGLAGNTPPNLNSVGPGSRAIKSDLLSSSFSNQISSDLLSKVYSSKIIVTSPNTVYKFNYQGEIGDYDISCIYDQSGNPINYSIDGAVDVNLILKDECGNIIFNENGSTNKGNTGNPQTLQTSSQETLQPGAYQITKTLKINESKLEQYWQEYLAQEDVCVLNREDFMQEELAKINVEGCGITCTECRDMVEEVISSSTILTPEDEEKLRSACDQICDNQQIACLSALQAMRGDLSPGGQYGQLRKEIATSSTDLQVSLDANNQPVIPTVDAQISNPDADGFHAPTPDDYVVNAEEFPLSIFNEKNSLNKPDFQSSFSGLQQNIGPHWRYPVQVSHPGYAGENWKNQVLFQSDIDLSSGLTYAETNYLDAKGDIFYVDIFATVNSNGMPVDYKPGITSASDLIPVNQDLNHYKIPVKYLANLADFEKYFMPHWANYLLPYHPEFKYYLECTSHHLSHAFDNSLIDAATIQQAISAGFIVNGTPAIIGNSATASLDPFIQTNEGFYNSLNAKNASYKELTIAGNTEMRSMAETVTISTGCPNDQQPLCGPSTCTDGIIDTDSEWNIYRAYYLAEKQQIIRAQALIKAVDGLYYNGCIGQKDYRGFLLSSEDEYFRREVDVVTPVTVTKRKCSKFWFDPFDWTLECHNVTYTMYEHSTTYPYLNPGQVCYIETAFNYENKAPRFYPRITQGEGAPATNCETYVMDNSVSPPKEMRISVPCEEDVQEALELLTEEAQRFTYNSCGQCPIAAEVEQLLKELNSKDLLIPSESQILTCDNEQSPVRLSTVLRRELLLLNGQNQDIRWSATTSLGGKLLEGRFVTGSTTIATISLRIPDNIPVTFDNLGKMCCLSVSSTSIYFPFEAGKIFTLHSSYGNILVSEDFTIEGHISLALAPCTIPPRCFMTDDATRISLFLNMLATANTTGKTHNLNTNSTDVSLEQTSNIDFYKHAVRAILRQDDRNVYGFLEDVGTVNPRWNSYVTGDLLYGVFKYTQNGNKEKVIEVSGLPAAYSYSQIVEFLNLRPEKIDMNSSDPCRNASCNKETFIADAIVINGGQRYVVPVTITAPGMNAVTCRPAVAGTN